VTYGVVSGRAAAAVAYGLIAVEVALGAALLAAFRSRMSAAAGSLLMVLFMGVTAYGWSTGRTEECGCFGSLSARTPGQVLLEDAGFLALGLGAFFLAPRAQRGRPWRGIAVAAALAG